MDHRNNFDLLRLFAALDVVCQHISHLGVTYPSWLILIVETATGVPIFFIISGFLITASFFAHEGNLSRYFASRALRIYPAMWANLVFIAVMLMAFGVLKMQTIASEPFARFCAVMLTTGSMVLADQGQDLRFYWNDAIQFFPGGALWTIVLELGFYVMVPLIFIPAIRRRKPLAIAVLALAGLCSYLFCRSITNPSDIWFAASPFPHFWMFAIGGLAYLCWPRIEWLFRDRFFVWLVLYLAGRYLAGGKYPTYFHPSWLSTLLMFLLAGCVLSFAYSFRGLSRTALRGHDISYGVYLHHMPVLMLLLAFGWRGWAGVAILIPATICAGLLSWLAIERPALALKSRIGRLSNQQVVVPQLV